jgi:hypothetical protein
VAATTGVLMDATIGVVATVPLPAATVFPTAFAARVAVTVTKVVLVLCEFETVALSPTTGTGATGAVACLPAAATVAVSEPAVEAELATTAAAPELEFVEPDPEFEPVASRPVGGALLPSPPYSTLEPGSG